MNSKEITDKYRFLVALYTVTDTGKVKCTNTFFNRYLKGLYSKYKRVLSWEDVLSVAMYETVKYLGRFEVSNDSWEGMIEGTDLENLNKFYAGLKTAVNFSVFWEANPTTIQKKKNKTKTSSAYSYYITPDLTSLDIDSDQESENTLLQERIGEENKLSYAQNHETEQLYSLAVFIMKEENRKKYFNEKFNDKYELLKNYHLDSKEDRKEFLEILRLSSKTGASAIASSMRNTIEKTVNKLGVEEERIIPNEKEATSKSLLYYEYFDLLDSLEPEEELSELSKWLREHETELDSLLYTYLNYNQCRELTRLFKKAENSISKKTLYTITNILYKDLEQKVSYLLVAGTEDRTVIEYEITEKDYRQFKNQKLYLDSSGMIREA